ncbi:hypothetical protein [Cronobacter condimenti]|uniref:hypothetical protein n=1 Tax=Cronobacter condimenti TaxID=1163710 RepID=UPI00100EB870|nr:hypothetical protein [Cronobacter condimenti]
MSQHIKAGFNSVCLKRRRASNAHEIVSRKDRGGDGLTEGKAALFFTDAEHFLRLVAASCGW